VFQFCQFAAVGSPMLLRLLTYELSYIRYSVLRETLNKPPQ